MLRTGTLHTTCNAMHVSQHLEAYRVADSMDNKHSLLHAVIIISSSAFSTQESLLGEHAALMIEYFVMCLAHSDIRDMYAIAA